MAWHWNRDHFREIIHFGKWIAVSSIASFFASQFGTVILRTLLSSSVLGVYSIASALVGAAPRFRRRRSIVALALSVLGEVLRESPTELRRKYYRFRFPIDALSATIGGLLFATAPQIVGRLYDSRYSLAGPMLQISL